MNTKLDLKKEYRQFYHAGSQPQIVIVPPLPYLLVSGEGHPSSDSYQQAAQAIFGCAYTLKFMFKESIPSQDFVVMPLEMQWFVDRTIKGRFTWNMLILQPDFITNDELIAAKVALAKKKPALDLSNVHLQTMKENLCCQVLHTGDYNRMNDTLHQMQDWLITQGYHTVGDTHDIYLNDSRKTPVEKLRAIMRIQIEKIQPAEKEPGNGREN